jgi:N-acetylmuramoyl-L-alanine amidase
MRVLFARHGPIVLFLLLAFAGMIAVYSYFKPDKGPLEAAAEAVGASSESLDPDALSAPITKNARPLPVTQRLAQSPMPTRVAIVAGHRGNDSGTVCADGLTEVQITTAVADRAAAILTQEGLTTDVLDEFDARLDGYFGTALVALHVDSCDYINDLATGFKVAGSSFTDSSSLSICMEQAYGASTQLPFNVNTVTPEMTDYHAFREIAPGTPAIIIELGFLNLDRAILTAGSDKVVQGIVDGISCFVKQQP